MFALVEGAAIDGNGKTGCRMGYRESHYIARHDDVAGGKIDTQEIGVARLQQVIGNLEFAVV